MREYFKVSSILSFIGAAAFVIVVMETGKLAFLGISLVMLCNGVSLWSKLDEKEQTGEANK